MISSTRIDRATRLVDQLLTLSRLDSLAQLDDVQQVAIADLLQSAVMEMYHPAQQSGIELRLHLNASHIVRTGQPLLLSLLVRNLLDNAVRYSPRGSQVDITLNAREFRVRDNGQALARKRSRALASVFIVRRGRRRRAAAWLVDRPAHHPLHGMQVDFANARDGGFEARVYW